MSSVNGSHYDEGCLFVCVTLFKSSQPAVTSPRGWKHKMNSVCNSNPSS